MRLKWLIAQIAMLIILLPAIASAATTPGIYVNGERVAGGGAPIQIKSDTYIPFPMCIPTGATAQ